MKSIRLTNFSVNYPQLEHDPNAYRIGRKRFNRYKNEVSLGILAAVPTLSSEERLKNAYDINDRNSNYKLSDNIFNINRPKPFNYFTKVPNHKKQSVYFKNDSLIITSNKSYESPPPNLRMANFGSHVLLDSKQF